MEFSVLIECEFVAVVSWKVGWLCFFNTKFALVRSDDWGVSFTRPWAVFTRLGRPDEWLVRTLLKLSGTDCTGSGTMRIPECVKKGTKLIIGNSMSHEQYTYIYWICGFVAPMGGLLWSFPPSGKMSKCENIIACNVNMSTTHVSFLNHNNGMIMDSFAFFSPITAT